MGIGGRAKRQSEIVILIWDLKALIAQSGKLHIDNNAVENVIHPSQIGKRNHRFAGSHEGAKRAAILYAFMEAVKR